MRESLNAMSMKWSSVLIPTTPGKTPRCVHWTVCLPPGWRFASQPFPAPHDPDSYIKEFGGPAFGQLIETAQGFFDYYLDRLCVLNDVAGDRGRTRRVKAMAEAVYKTASHVLFDTYAQKTALRLGVAAQAVRNEFKKSSGSVRVDIDESDEASAGAVPRLAQAESWLLRFLLETDDYVPWVSSYLELDWLVHPMVREIVAQRFAAEANDTWQGLAPWLTQLANPEWQNLITEILADSHPGLAEKNLKGLPTRDSTIKILRDKYIERQLAALNQRLDAPDLREEEQRLVLTQIDSLRRLKKLPLSPKPQEGEA